MKIFQLPMRDPAKEAGVTTRGAGLRKLAMLPALLICAFMTSPVQAVQQVEIYSLSLRFESATATEASGTWRLALTTGSQQEAANGELALAEGANNFTHAGFFLLTEVGSGATAYHSMSLNIPTNDGDGNGIYDVLEQRVVEGVETTGVYRDGSQNTHPIRATWNKAAGSHIGSCALELPDLGLAFVAAFENIHYSGEYLATKTGSNLAGPMTARRNGVETSTLSGGLNLQIISETQLAWGIGEWQTESGGVIAYEGSDLDRSGPLEYSAFYVTIEDGDLKTAISDYQTWLLVLPNIPDANGNGTPDLIEGGAVAAGPRLALSKNGNAVTLTVTGGEGRTFDLESKSSLSGAWEKAGRFTFATDSESILVNYSSDGNAFWQLKE